MGGKDLVYPSLVRLLVTPDAVIPAGRYRFQMKVLIPSVLPVENFWHLALCRTTECLGVNDPGLLVSFVLTGFLLGESSPLSIDGTADCASQKSKMGLVGSAIALFLFSYLEI